MIFKLFTTNVVSIRSFHSILNVVDRGVLQVMWEELAGKVGPTVYKLSITWSPLNRNHNPNHKVTQSKLSQNI